MAMTEQEWLDNSDPFFMLDFLAEKASARKFRLFAVACWRLWIDSEKAEGRPDCDHDSMDRYELEGCGRDDEAWARECACYDSDGVPDGGPDVPFKSAFVRDIFGNPFRPVTFNPAWRTSNVTALAQAIYDDRAFDRLPILADALEDAGCDRVDILNHCRQPGEHVRGCWVVDLVLGKE
jgi:hypothetical protein